MKITELEFTELEQTLVVTYFTDTMLDDDDWIGLEIDISEIEKWGKNEHELIFKGEQEYCIGADYTGEPEFHTSTWDFQNFSELDSENKLELIKLFIQKK